MNLSSAIFRGPRLGLVALLFALAGCGDAPPSKAEAAMAISDVLSHNVGLGMLNAMAQSMAGQKPTDTPPQLNIEVTDLTCQKLADRIYTCAVSGATNGQQWPQLMNVKFTNLDGAWHAELLTQ